MAGSDGLGGADEAPPPAPATLSIVTATFNAAAWLPRLIASLQAQTDANFEWVVADGASTDGTLAILEQAAATLPLRVDSRRDFGIYDALNRAIRMASGAYYVVLGADDELFPESVARYRAACNTTAADFVAARVEIDGRVCGLRTPRWEWLHGAFAHVSGHAVALAIRRDLHERIGWYSRRLPLAADQLFILQAVHAGAQVSEQAFVAGRFAARGGTSGDDPAGTLTEGFRARLLTGHRAWPQIILLLLRLARHHARLGAGR